ncbi:conserved hypothetical protein [Neospora caninum Liverpool]|uniref:LamG-like jellyroll fold domain-containing protein n=1 Tax=Neospora caninum (strain Liverpool) TaxID=572307 RepID=F0VPV5_NEOCL|nr:conserved hypothetical protein [Neospora caninum Liverpool]CBZ55752.1 conserved hypothetical protein [Neospora caninum Liverpool]|eukprot:XP_003885778.1 conserved hypothetical protein [Neospora caninum Liverpool]
MAYSKFIVGVCSGVVASFGMMMALTGVETASLPGNVIEGSRDFVLKAKTVLNFADRIYDKCFSVPNSLCLGGTSQIITANAVPEGLSAWFTFDEIYPVDQSGNGNHMHRAPRAGPPHNGKGASAAFVNGASGTIKSSPTLESSDFTRLLDVPFGRLERLLSSDANQTPTILLYPKTRKLSIRVTTTDSTSEGIPSRGSLPLRRWTHIAVTANESRLKLFINGVKDNQVALRGVVVSNSGDMVIGSTLENSGFEGYIDDLRLYSRALPKSCCSGWRSSEPDPRRTHRDCRYRICIPRLRELLIREGFALQYLRRARCTSLLSSRALPGCYPYRQSEWSARWRSRCMA